MLPHHRHRRQYLRLHFQQDRRLNLQHRLLRWHRYRHLFHHRHLRKKQFLKYFVQ
jgi:hypothetical protein